MRVVDDDEVAVRVERLRKIALPFQRCGNSCEKGTGCRLAETFIVGEEERAVPAIIELGKPHWAANSIAELIALEVLFLLSGIIGVVTIRIENAIAQIVVYRTVERIRSVLSGKRNDSTARAPPLRIVCGGQNLEFTDELYRRNCSGLVGISDSIGSAI